MKKFIISFLLSLYALVNMAATITLNQQNSHVVVNLPGTVTFNANGITLEEVAKRENLKHISNKSYKAAVIYDIVFTNGHINSRGKVFNCSNKTLIINCNFYNGNQFIQCIKVNVKPRTFSRIIPNEVPLSKLEHATKIVISY